MGRPKVNRKRLDLKILSILFVLVFGGARFASAFNCGAQRVPGETGAFDARGELAQTGEDIQLARRRAAPQPGLGAEAVCRADFF
jgi:hypothetical protein